MKNQNDQEILLNFRKKTQEYNLLKIAKELQISPKKLFAFFVERKIKSRKIKKLSESQFNSLASFILERLHEINPEHHKINKSEQEIKKIRKLIKLQKEKAKNRKSNQTSVFDKLRKYKYTPYIFKNRIRN